MIQIKKCKMCGNKFESERGALYCSDECKEKKLKIQWANNNLRRKMRKDGETPMRQCLSCGNYFPAGRKEYCSPQCKEQGKLIRYKKYQDRYYQENKNAK